ncbi:hypothetical protein [Saccharomonospora piscinae]|uniref:hypothetical protein n=1 Tax=Saccharomonospora piscinae TaxID=687388 RepID=UPI0004649217|nr:hypothetical protein [Saccharomonospora piscinae]
MVELSAWLLRHTPVRPLVVAVPGGTGARLAVERAVRERGWRPARGPAEANVLVVAGAAGPDLEPHLSRVYDAVPAPRERVDVAGVSDADPQLDAAATALRDLSRQRERLPATRGTVTAPQAIRSLRLGPVAPLWPAGLTVHAVVRDGLLADVSTDVAGEPAGSFWTADNTRARALDAAARLLAVAGWPDAAQTAAYLRDTALARTFGAEQAPSLRRWARRVRGSPALRRLLTGVGRVPPGPSVPRSLTGDARRRLHRWVTVAAGDGTSRPARDEATPWALAALPGLLRASPPERAGLVVASLDPDADALVGTHAG